MCIPVIYTDDGIIGVDMSNECIIISECSLSVTLLDLLKKILTRLYIVQGFSVGYHRYESTTPYIQELRVEQRKESLMIGTFEEM
jgi:hypothetical protein